MKKLIPSLFVGCLLLSAITPAQATLFLDSWGISYGSWDVKGQAPSYVDYYVEDWIGAGNGRVWPGFGGDAFDVEAVYYGLDVNYAYIAVVTGLRPTGVWGYLPGDIAIDFDGDNNFEYGIDIDAGGNLRHGHTSWENPLLDWGGVSDPWRVLSSDHSVGIGGFSYAPFDGRYAIEAKIDRGLFSNEGGYHHIHWTMGCGNDAGDLVGCATATPEPGTLLLLSSGLFGMGAWGRFRRGRGLRR